MPYGTIKVDTVTFTNDGVDKSVSISGLVQNPTFSGNVTVTGTLSGVTVTGTTASFTSGNFTNISGSTHTITSGVFAAGSATNPSISFTSDPNTGIYSPGADQVAISTNGTARIYINSVGDVGVGTLSIATGGATTRNFQLHNTSSDGTYFKLTNGATGATASDGTDLIVDGSGNGYFFNRENAALIFGAGNLERLRITSDGKVGLGTSTPGNTCEVYVGIPSNNDSGITLTNGNNVGFGTSLSFSHRTSTGGAIATRSYISSEGGGGNSFLRFATTIGGTLAERVRIDEAGRVGVGTTSPGAILHSVVSSAGIAFRGSHNNTGLDLYTNDAIGEARITAARLGGSGGKFLSFYTDTGSGEFERVRIDSSGRLLVGTSSSRQAGGNTGQIQLEGTNTNNSAFTITYNANDSNCGYLVFGKTRGAAVGGTTVVQDGDTLGRIDFAGANGSNLTNIAAFIAGQVDGAVSGGGANDMPGRLVFSTTADGASSPTEAMRINNGQELLIGYTTDNGAYKLQVNSQIFATSAIIATSDGRYKENVATLEGCVDLVKALRPVSFDWKLQKDITRIDDKGNEILVREGHNFPDGTQVGFIAQEVQEVLADKPWLSSVIKQNVRPAVKDNDGNELAPEEEFLGIAEGNLIAVLTSALQEAIGEIESLKARVAALESA